MTDIDILEEQDNTVENCNCGDERHHHLMQFFAEVLNKLVGVNPLQGWSIVLVNCEEENKLPKLHFASDLSPDLLIPIFKELIKRMEETPEEEWNVQFH